jgi:hypothetical protein
MKRVGRGRAEDEGEGRGWGGKRDIKLNYGVCRRALFSCNLHKNIMRKHEHLTLQ